MHSPTIQPSRIAAFALSALLLTGCATMNVSSYLERGIDLRPYRTYIWGPSDTVPTGDPRLDNNRFVDERVRTQVEKVLASRGVEKTTSPAPDLIVHYHLSVRQKIDIREIDRNYAYCRDDDCGPYVYDAGTLLVDLVDRRTGKIVFRGWAEGSVDGVVDNQEWLEARIAEAITRIFERFPRRL